MERVDCAAVPPFVKRRTPAVPGSIPDVLGMFHAEVRFYREIAPVIGVRVPACYRAEDDDSGTLLEIEDLSGWRPGADPAAAAALLGGMHRRWLGEAPERWPWLRPLGAGVDLVEHLFAETWAGLGGRGDLPSAVASFGARMAEPGHVAAAEEAIAAAGPLTLVHGDAQAGNMRTSPDGEVALLDWEDVSAAPGVLDLAWLLTASVGPGRWDEAIAAYGPASGLDRVLPAVMVQGLFLMADTPAGSPEARAQANRLAEGCRRLS
jgi:Phosphotransferase enzyme family